MHTHSLLHTLLLSHSRSLSLSSFMWKFLCFVHKFPLIHSYTFINNSLYFFLIFYSSAALQGLMFWLNLNYNLCKIKFLSWGSLSLTHTHTHTNSLIHTLSLSLTHSLLATNTSPLLHTHTHTYTLSLFLLHTHAHTHTHTHTHPKQKTLLTGKWHFICNPTLLQRESELAVWQIQAVVHCLSPLTSVDSILWVSSTGNES